MKKQKTLLLAAWMTAASVGATEPADTLFVVGNRQIEICDSLGATKVKVFDAEGHSLRKLSETVYVDGQEVEQVYVTSPFLPNTRSGRRHRFADTSPDIYIGRTLLPGAPIGFSSAAGLPARDSRSNEWGVTALGMAWPFNAQHTFGLTCALQAGIVHHHFNVGYVLDNVDGQAVFRPNGEQGVKSSFLRYVSCRLPVMLEFQQRDFFFAAGMSMEMRGNDVSKWRDKKRHTVSRDLNINPFGANLELRAGYSAISVSLRAALTPLFRGGMGPECYPVFIGLGLRY